MASQPTASRGIPIRMPRDVNAPGELPSIRTLRKIRSIGTSTPTSSRRVPRSLNKPSPAQVVVLKRKRHEEPLDGLLLDTESRAGSDVDLSKSAATGDTSPVEEGGEDEGEALGKPSLHVRKRKKVTPSRGFFQLADTVESAKWDDEAWRRDFNERVLAKSKETKKALAAAAGVEIPLDSPVIEKSQPSPSSPLKDAMPKTPRRYTAVLQKTPSGSDNATKSKEKGKQASLTSKGVTCADDAPSRGVPAAATIQYFNAVLVPDSEKGGKSEIEKQEEDEIAAFLPMLQEYLKLHDIPPAKVVSEKKPTTKGQHIDRASPSPAIMGGHDSETGSHSTSDDEYVYDVYFKGNHEPTSSDWNNLGNYGTLIGLPPQDRDYDRDSDEIEDNSDYDIDDDSNDEDFYRNDYPDEEDEESDYEESDEFYDERDDSEEEEDYDYDAPWRQQRNPYKRAI